MLKKLLTLLAIFIFFFLPKSSLAFKAETFVTFSNPVRGYEGWLNKKQTPLDLPIFQYQESTPSAFPITWLLRYDAVDNATISAYFKNLLFTDQNQSLGALLEITPSLTQKAGIPYPDGFSIMNANRIFLSGYTQNDRRLLIDTYMDSFFIQFGFYPQSIAACSIDSYSLLYLQAKYSVLSAMTCDDQYSTDNNRIWGGYVGSPYFPDKNNSLLPASGLKNRVNLAMVKWNQKDLYNFYSAGLASMFSVQKNDFLTPIKKAEYFDNLLDLYQPKILNEFGYINIGLENDLSLLPKLKQQIINTYSSLKTNEGKNEIRFISLADFGDWFKARYPESSPVYFYRTGDPMETEKGEVIWYQSSHYRIGLKSYDGNTKIIDFRVYNRSIYEDYFITPNQDTSLFTETPAIVDSVKYPGSELSLDVDLSGFKTVYDKQWDLWQLTLASGDKKIIFFPDSIKFTNITPPVLNSKDLKVTIGKTDTTWTTNPKVPLKDYFHYSWIFWILLATVILLGVKKLKKSGKPKMPLCLLVGLAGVLLTGLTVFRNGFDFPFGQAFFGPNGHDAIFHLSLIEKFSQNPLDFSHPQYAGAKLTNYHFVFDYFSGVISKVMNIPPATLYFRLLPLIFGLILVLLLEKLMAKWNYSRLEKVLGFTFVFFASSFGFIPRLLGGDLFAGESAFWSNQSASLFLNPPYVLSLIFLLWFLLILPSNGKITPGRFIKLAILGAILAQTKVYAFILLGIALLINRRFLLAITIGLLGGLLSLPFTSVSGSPFSFDPLWFPRSLFASFDRLYWPRLVEAWQSYEASGNFIKLLAVNIFAALVFIVGNLGLRILGLFGLAKTKPVDLSEKIVWATSIVGLILPLIFTQKVNPWNTIQFTYYSLFFLGLVTAKIVAQISLSIRNLFLRVGFLIIIVFLATLTSVGTLRDYIGSLSPSRVSFTEMQALQTLRDAPRGIVLSPLYQNANRIAVPKPLYAYVSTAYISALSGQREFMSDTINLDITGFDYKERARDVLRFYNTADATWAKSFLEKNKIKYIYETQIQKMTLDPSYLSLTKIFDSGEINIYKTK